MTNARADGLPDLSLDQLVELERRAAERAAGERGDDDGDGDDGDDGGTRPVVVLPWWQHPWNIVTLVVTAAVLAAMIGWMVGDSQGRPRHNEVDTGFLQDMRVHHDQAVFMSFVFRSLPDTDPGLANIAGAIIMGQSQDIGRMVQLLRGFGEAEAADLSGPVMGWMGMATTVDQMPGIASDDDLAALQAAEGAAADALFVELMVAHHTGGVHMAQYAAAHAADDEVRAMASSIVSSQQSEIEELESRIG